MTHTYTHTTKQTPKEWQSFSPADKITIEVPKVTSEESQGE